MKIDKNSHSKLKENELFACPGWLSRGQKAIGACLTGLSMDPLLPFNLNPTSPIATMAWSAMLVAPACVVNITP
jgi:hypothetical protein